MNLQLAKILSYIGHPAIVPTVAFSLLFYFCPQLVRIDPENYLTILSFIFLSTFMVPVLCAVVLLNLKVISSLHMPDRKERLMPMTFTSVYYTALTYLLLDKVGEVNLVFPAVMGAIALVCSLATFITVFYKVSAHSAAWAGVFGLLAAWGQFYEAVALIYPAIAVVLLGGAVMSARLALAAHKGHEIVVGMLLGFSVSYTTMWLVSL